MRNSIQVATKNTKKATKKQVLAILTNAKDSLQVSLPENVNGEKIKKAKKLGEIMQEKISINNAEKLRRRSLTYNLNALKGSAENYADLLGKKYGVNVSIDELMNTLKKPSIFLAYLSEKQKTQFEAKKLGFSYWLILGLISKHFQANKPKKTA